MELIFLGTGTSQGIPIIGCPCAVCRSDDPRDRRTRASIALRFDTGAVVLVDTSPELRLQSLATGLDRLDAVLFTHSHADHVMGLDDVRAFNQRQGNVIPCIGDATTVAALRRIFGYAEIPPGGERHADRPGVTFHAADGPFDLLGHTVTPIPLPHASIGTLGFRIGNFAYCTDCSRMPDDAVTLLRGLDVLVLGMLRRRPHPAHMSVDESLEAAGRIGAQRTYFTHMCHDLPHAATNAGLPRDKQLAHDGLVVRIDE